MSETENENIRRVAEAKGSRFEPGQPVVRHGEMKISSSDAAKRNQPRDHAALV
jgi:hypothetical protein